MALLDSPWKNLVLGLASRKNPGLLSQAYQTQVDNINRQRQVDEDQRRRDMEDYKFGLLKQEQGARDRLGGLLGFNPESMPGASLPKEDLNRQIGSTMFQAGFPEQALSFLNPKPKAETTLEQNLRAAGYTPGTPQFQEQMQKAIFQPKNVINNIPAAPSGYRHKENPDGTVELEPVKGGPVYESAQLEYEKKIAGLEKLENAVDTLISAVQEKGTEYSLGPINAASAQDMSSKATDVMIELKTLFELGALQKPDLEIMERALIDPASLKGNWKGSGAVMAGLDTIKNKVKSQYGVINKQYSRFGFGDKNLLKAKYGLE